MFCACCRIPGQRSGGFFAEGIAEPVLDPEAALARRAAYRRRSGFTAAPAAHPEQSDFVIREACILTMDANLGDLPVADLHVRDGVIMNLGRDLRVTGMLEIDARSTVAIPGFIAGHRHLCSDLLAGAPAERVAPPCDGPDGGLPDLSPAAEADIYRAVRLALLDALSAGITTVNHCGYDIGGAHAETAIIAQLDSGVRGRFSFPLDGPAADPASDADALAKLGRNWFTAHGDHLLELGVSADRMPGGLAPIAASLPAAVGHDEPAPETIEQRTGEAARGLGLDYGIGSLSPGKCADLVLIDAGARGQAGRLSPPEARACVRHASAADVVLVAVDGRLRKRNGVLVEPNEGLIRREGRDAIARLREAARWPQPGAAC